MKAHFKKLYEYNHWANSLFVKALASGDHKNEKIDLLFSHIATVQMLWLNRITPLEQSVPGVFEIMPLAEISRLLDFTHERIMAIIETCEDFDRIITYRTLEGEYFSNCLADLLTHLANHGTHHRSQIALLLREEGIVPPASDFFYYLRALEQKN